MKIILILVLCMNHAWSKESVVVPAFLEAARIYLVSDRHEAKTLTVFRPEILGVLHLLLEQQISKDILRRYLENANSLGPNILPEDRFDQWITSLKAAGEVPALSLHALKIKVREESDDVTKDDIYAYFFITDGVVPIGKVTSIYKGLSRGETFFFNEQDRVLFPQGIPSVRPTNHLIVDYGIIESDGDDVKDLQKLTAIIVDVAITVYTQIQPAQGQVLGTLRQEVKALANLLSELDHDDRLVTDSFGYTTEELRHMLSESTYVELRRRHKHSSTLDDWSYDITFRLIRD